LGHTSAGLSSTLARCAHGAHSQHTRSLQKPFERTAPPLEAGGNAHQRSESAACPHANRWRTRRLPQGHSRRRVQFRWPAPRGRSWVDYEVLVGAVITGAVITVAASAAVADVLWLWETIPPNAAQTCAQLAAASSDNSASSAKLEASSSRSKCDVSVALVSVGRHGGSSDKLTNRSKSIGSNQACVMTLDAPPLT